MARFLCVCGEVIHTSGEIPNDQELFILRDREIPDEGLGWPGIAAAATSAFECPRSGHLWVFWKGFGEDPQGYAPLAE